MGHIFRFSSLVLTIFVLASVANASQPMIPYREVTDTALYLRIAYQTRVSGVIHNWTAKGMEECYAMLHQIRQSERGEYYFRDTIVYLSLRYSLPKQYSTRDIQYTAILTFQFRGSNCINDDSLYDFCSTLISRIRSTEDTKGVSLFLENTQADSGRIVHRFGTFEWHGQGDTLKSSYWPGRVGCYPSFTFHNSTLLDSLYLYTCPWKLPQIEQFRKNSRIRYAKLYGDRIRVSSGPSCSGSHEYFIEFISGGTIDSFRLSNAKYWSTFKELVYAQSVAKQFLQSSGHSGCELSKSPEAGFTVLPSIPGRGCEACGNTIFVGVSCSGNPETMAVSVELLDYYRTGDVGFADTSVLK
jgi:hypothetical protein